MPVTLTVVASCPAGIIAGVATVAVPVALLATVIVSGLVGAWFTATVIATDAPTATLTGLGDNVIAGPTTLNGRLFESINVPAIVGCGFDTMTLNVHGVVGHAVESISDAGTIIEMCEFVRNVTGDSRCPLKRIVLLAKKLLPNASSWNAAVATTRLAGTMPFELSTGVIGSAKASTVDKLAPEALPPAITTAPDGMAPATAKERAVDMLSVEPKLLVPGS